MDGVAAADGTELAGAEHPGQRRRAKQISDHGGVVVGRVEELAAASVAGEYEGTAGGTSGQYGVEVLVGAGGVAHLELHGRTHRHGVAHRHRAGCTVDAEHAADEEIAPFELNLGFVDHDTTVQTLLGEVAVGW